MPELPEVEVTRRRIEGLLVGRRISRVLTTARSYFFLTDPRLLRRRLPGREITGLDRHGKYLIARLDDGQRLLLHLGMSGQLFGENAASPRLLSASARAALSPQEQAAFTPDRHTHLQLCFEDGGARVLMRDVRKFGKVRLLQPGEREPRLEKLGVDALAATAEQLFQATRGRKVQIKSLLLDQASIAGIGNIYADECLFRARLRPTRRAHRVARKECEALIEALHEILQRAIDSGGSSISDYVAPDGRDGSYQDERYVYARAAEPCPVCATPIRKISIAQRGTHFCPKCQR
ncbi:MAG: bifunctional DNA-formamidopyrimidine glycosylase/DNA-(apurinic or apyrimidinic site) lyase [Myxococcota bacterium]